MTAKKSKKSLKKKLTVALTVVAALMLAPIFLTAVFRPDNPTTTPEEIQAALMGYVAYYGSCAVDVENKTISTQVEGSMYPNWVGGQQVRFYELTDQYLVLKTTPVALGDEEFTGVLTWERK